MTHREEDIDARLERLGRATHGIHARADFTARVLRAAELQRPRSFFDELLGPARRIVPVAALAAVIALAFAVRSGDDVDDALAASYDAEASEIAW